jgi:hypothetical protein
MYLVQLLDHVHDTSHIRNVRTAITLHESIYGHIIMAHSKISSEHRARSERSESIFEYQAKWFSRARNLTEGIPSFLSIESEVIA